MTAAIMYPAVLGMKLPKPSFCATKMKLTVTIVISNAGMRVIKYHAPRFSCAKKTVMAHSVTIARTWLAHEK